MPVAICRGGSFNDSIASAYVLGVIATKFLHRVGEIGRRDQLVVSAEYPLLSHMHQRRPSVRQRVHDPADRRWSRPAAGCVSDARI